MSIPHSVSTSLSSMEIFKRQTMWTTKLALLCLTLTLLQAATLAEKKSYVVYLGAHDHPAEEQSLYYVKGVRDSHHEFLSSYVGSLAKAKDSIFYSYEHHINGFAAMLDEKEAAEIAKHPKVVSVFLNRGKKLHTTHSWETLMLEKAGELNPDSIWANAKFGKDVIIATMDSGAWPESPSFNDEGYGPIPKRWRGRCQNNTKSIHGAPCNRKLIGANFYNKGYPNISWIEPIQRSPRDFGGHGSHTLSTAGGNFVEGAIGNGMFKGTPKGGSPSARVAAYKVCWPPSPIDRSECFDADMLKAVDDAIHDGVDVISMSLGGNPVPYFEDVVAIASFHAVKKGIVVVCSAGNEGPDPFTVTNLAPWIITVGASTTDRFYRNFVELGSGLSIKGVSKTIPTLPEPILYPLVNSLQAKASNASDNDALRCNVGSLDPSKVEGKIILCLRGESPRLEKGYVASFAGAVGMILRNDVENADDDVVSEAHVLPASHITYGDGLAVLKYINSSKNPTAYIADPMKRFGAKPAPKMADFSGVGPNSLTPEILKPDITAPGVDIVAAFTPADLNGDLQTSTYASLDGTSMSCPHVSGIVGLLKTLYPHWTPAAIKSAIMTTGRVRDDVPGAIQDPFGEKATPLNYGSGHVRPNRAQDPGLVYDLSIGDYLNFLCASGYNATQIQSFSQGFKCSSSYSLLDFNYPSITVPHFSKPVTVTRRLKNVGSPGKYISRVHHPLGVEVFVEPRVLEFKEVGEEKSFRLTLRAKGSKGISGYTFGGLVWSDGLHYVRSPIVVSSDPPTELANGTLPLKSLNV